MGRAPCCEKVGLKKGRWTAEEDETLKSYIQTHGEGSWRSLPKNAGLLRCGKSCRLRWINYLRTDVKRGNITPQEEDVIVKLHATMGNRWSLIAGHLPGRTDNEIKNYWNSHLSRKIHYFRKSFTNNNDQSTFGASKSVATTTTTVVQPPPRRRGNGRVSRSAMKKNRHLFLKSVTKANASTTATTQETAVNTSESADDVEGWARDTVMCDERVQVGVGVGVGVEDHCTNELLWLDEMMVDPDGNLMVQPDECGVNSSCSGECTGPRMEWGWDPADGFGCDQLKLLKNMGMEEEEEEGSRGASIEKEKIISWLWDGADDQESGGGVEETVHDDVSGAKELELDNERQEAMIAWLMS